MTETTAPAQTVAFMDIGTNSIRLLVVQIGTGGSYRVVHQLKETVRLGEGEFTHHQLQPAAIDRAALVCRQFAMVARSAGAEEIIAVATSATREAENRETFLRRLRHEADIDVHVVSGLEEARLVYLGVSSGIHIEGKQALFIDIGGGSTEVIVGNQSQALYLNSLRLGAIRLTTRFLPETRGPVSLKQYEQIRAYIRNDAAITLHELQEHRLDLAIGSSGTIENLAEIAARLFLKRPLQRDDTLAYFHIRETIPYLCSLPLEERRRVPGMNPARADIIVAGAAVLETLMDSLGLRELRVSDRGLREGLLEDFLLRHGQAPVNENASVRDRSVLQLGRACGFNETHARATARLALQLFDSARAAGVHKLGEEARELLEYASMLHHIGAFLTYTNYQKHTHYLISNAELLGFDQTEIAIMAATALYHRGGVPRKKDLPFAGLTLASQQIVRVLSTFLRLAESLDRSQSGSIAEARILGGSSSGYVLQVDAERDCQVELWSLANQIGAFEKVFGRPLAIKEVARRVA